MTGAGIDAGAVPGAPASAEMAAVPGAAAAPGAVAVPDAAASRARRARWRGGGAAREDRSTRIAVVVVVLALLASVAAVLAQGRFREAPYEPSSPLPAGSKALVSVLEEQGAEVGTVRRTDEAARDLRAGGTVLVTDPSALGRDQLELLRSALDAGEGRLVLLAPDFGSLSVLALGIRPTGRVAEDAPAIRADASCADASFRARTVRAGELPLDDDGEQAAPGLLYTGGSGTRSCFRTDAGAAVVRTDDVIVLGSARFITNEGLREADGPAVALNAIGTAGPVTWYLPSATDPMASDLASPLEQLPPWTGPVALWLAVCVLLALWALSWRLGPVVVEPLPVSVRSQELTVGRAHLLRRAGARDSAARSLRSAAAVRLADRLGVRRREGLDALIAAIVPHSRRDGGEIRRLLGPEPVASDAELVRLAHDLDRLEKEIDR